MNKITNFYYGPDFCNKSTDNCFMFKCLNELKQLKLDELKNAISNLPSEKIQIYFYFEIFYYTDFSYGVYYDYGKKPPLEILEMLCKTELATLKMYQIPYSINKVNNNDGPFSFPPFHSLRFELN